MHRSVLAAGGASAGLEGPALLDAALDKSPDMIITSVLSELAVEPLRTEGDADAHYVAMQLAAVQKNLVGRQIAEVKSKLQRVSPVEDTAEYNALFGDLVALEKYRIELGNKANPEV